MVNAALQLIHHVSFKLCHIRTSKEKKNLLQYIIIPFTMIFRSMASSAQKLARFFPSCFVSSPIRRGFVTFLSSYTIQKFHQDLLTKR